jgi:hypothetical protein
VDAQKLLLLPTEWPNQIRPINPPTAQGIPCCFMPPNQLPVLFKADPMAIKEFVDVGGEQQAVGP